MTETAQTFKIVINTDELPNLIRAANAFTVVCNTLLGAELVPLYDQAVVVLQRNRVLLERLTAICTARNLPVPVAVLDQAAKRLYPNLAMRVHMAQQCSGCVHVLHEAIAVGLQVLLQQRPVEKISIDPSRLKQMN